MNADHIFLIGNEHKVCQDYALSGIKKIGNEELYYAIIADGCSASQNTDIGSRILALSAYNQLLINKETFNKEIFYKEILRRSTNLFLTFPNLSNTSIDSTLICTWIYGGKLNVFMAGDGCSIYRYNVGFEKSVTQIEFEKSAPDYISYYLDNERMSAYLKLTDNYKTLTQFFRFNENGPQNQYLTKTIVPPFDYHHFSTEIFEKGDVILITSDGIKSFSDNNNNPIPWETIVDEFTDFKNFNGEFVQRRISSFKRKCLKEGWKHYDDISVAAIVI